MRTSTSTRSSHRKWFGASYDDSRWMVGKYGGTKFLEFVPHGCGGYPNKEYA